METPATLNSQNMLEQLESNEHPVLSPQEYLAWWNTADPVNSGRKTMAACHQLVALSREQLAVQTRTLLAADPGRPSRFARCRPVAARPCWAVGAA